MMFKAGDKVRVVKVSGLTQSAIFDDGKRVTVDSELVIDQIVNLGNRHLVALFKVAGRYCSLKVNGGSNDTRFEGRNGVECDDLVLVSREVQPMSRANRERLIVIGSVGLLLTVLVGAIYSLAIEEYNQKHAQFKILPSGEMAIRRNGTDFMPVAQFAQKLIDENKPPEAEPARIGDGIRNFRDTTEELDKAAIKLNALLDRLNGGLDRIGTKGIVIKIEIPDGSADTD